MEVGGALYVQAQFDWIHVRENLQVDLAGYLLKLFRTA